jgi:uncharacterized protein YdaU (DUF1376 family)
MERMKKPSAYMPLYGSDFFEAITGYPEAVGLRYLRALWHYWHHTGCEGLPDDDEYLRRVCGGDQAEWALTKGIIFDDRYHFRLEAGVWQQPRCREEWRKSQAVFAARSKQGSSAARKRWKTMPGAMPDAMPRHRENCEKQEESAPPAIVNREVNPKNPVI